MGQKRIRRADRKKKRGWYGNQHTKKQGEDGIDTNSDDSDIEQESVAEEFVVSVEQQAADSGVNKAAFNTTASTSKLGNENFPTQQEQVSFDRDQELTGFRFIDTELLVNFVQSLLCPNCRRPLGENKRLSHVTESRSVLASTFVFHCQCKNSVALNTSKKCGKTYEVADSLCQCFLLGKI